MKFYAQTNPLMLAGLLFVGGVLGGLTVTTLQAIADQNPDTDDVPRIIPYQGVLEFDGVAWDASSLRDNVPLIEFDIFDGADLATRVYCERRTVEVFNGRFTALLGDANGRQDCADAVVSEIGDVVRNADDLYLKATLIDPFGDDPAQRVALSNAQRLLPAPYALWSTSATNFTVSRDLAVGGNANLAQLTVAGELNAAGPLNAQDNLNVAGALDATGAISTSADLSAAGTLEVSGAASLDQGLTVGGGIDIAGDMALGGDITTTFEGLQGATFQQDVVLKTNSRLYLRRTTDATVSTDGALVIGNVDAGNMTMDGNEIMTRNNGALSTLFMKSPVRFDENIEIQDGNFLDLGLEYAICANGQGCDEFGGDTTIQFTCPNNKNIIAGGGRCVNNKILKRNQPLDQNTWIISCDGISGNDGGAVDIVLLCGQIR